MEAQTASLTSAMAPLALSQWQVILIYILLIRSAVRKGIALWKAGTKKQMTRFIVMFILNTVGLLPIVYLAFFQKKEKGKK